MPPKVWHRTFPAGYGMEKALAAIRDVSPTPVDIGSPRSLISEVFQPGCSGEGFTLSSFTAQDAVELGHLLYARLLPFVTEEGCPVLISIAGAGGAQVYFQMATGPGTTPVNELSVRRKRAAALHFGVSTWFLATHYGAELSAAQAEEYEIEAGAVPIRVAGVEGVVGVVVVSGLNQGREPLDGRDHEVIAEVIRDNWE